jgi:hypothetical protein
LRYADVERPTGEASVATVTDVAKRVGLSFSIAARVLSGRGSVEGLLADAIVVENDAGVSLI